MIKSFLNIFIYIFFPTIFVNLFTTNRNSKDFILYLFISYILLMVYFIIRYKKELNKYISDFKLKDIKKVILIFIIGFSLMILSNYLINYIILPNNISNNELANRELLLNNKLIYSIVLCIIIPIIEEIVFRLEFKKSIKNKYIYLFLTSIIFALVHNISDTKLIELLYIIPYFILGYTFSLIYIKTDNISYSILSHMLNNIITVIAVLFY